MSTPVLFREITLRLGQTDAAGVLYAPRLLEMVHTLFEEILDEAGCGVARILSECSFILPIQSCDARYRAPLHVGERLRVHIELAKTRGAAFDSIYTCYPLEGGQVLAEARLRHIAVDRSSGRPLPEIPPELGPLFSLSS